ncbi:hypothetical protein CDD80_351 [Ophiocordyceps camponoti-rufipedis]|uniref:Uncharacterized protein n=1 Tax=Ophiocordyceps camponoti-rufipedis TaxID=2004952 RepID=A0A2C5ZMZ1_9HYPO|nr:hypothetical protein CDD80_351 [Ophiocordyceps camponoti-rufipedis]
MSKIFEAIIGARIAAAAEASGVLPDGQMSNRKHRSTEVAIMMVTEMVRATWSRKGLVPLDFTGTFDAVSREKLPEVQNDQLVPNETHFCGRGLSSASRRERPARE